MERKKTKSRARKGEHYFYVDLSPLSTQGQKKGTRYR